MVDFTAQEVATITPEPPEFTKKGINNFRWLLVAILFSFLLVGVGFFAYQKLFSPQTKMLSEIDAIIKLVESPDQSLVARYGITEDQVKSNSQQILDGAPDKNIPGLRQARKSIEQGNLTLAHKQLVDVFTTWLLARGIVRDDSIILSEEEKVKADPENQYFGRRAPMFSAVRKEMATRVIKLLYLLKK